MTSKKLIKVELTETEYGLLKIGEYRFCVKSGNARDLYRAFAQPEKFNLKIVWS